MKLTYNLLPKFRINETQSRRFFYAFLFPLFIPFTLHAQLTTTFTPAYLAIQKKIYTLELSQAQTGISQELKSSPNNVTGYYLQDKALFLKAFITETEEDLQAFNTHHHKAVKQFIELSNNLPYKAFFLSETYTHKALLNFKVGNNYTAALALKGAYQYLELNKTSHPSFLPTYKNLVLFEIAASQMVEGYNWLLKIVGVNTQYQQSLALAEKLTRQNFSNEFVFFKKETALTLAYIYKQLLPNHTKSLDFVRQETGDFAKNPLSTYFLSTFLYKNGQNDEALKTINAAKFNDNQQSIPFIQYIKGLCLLNKLDPSSYDFFAQYVNTHKGPNYIKSSHLKMAWAKLMANDPTAYYKQMALIKSKGKHNTEEDKQALLELNRQLMPSMVLLKSRLLYDGGYYALALEQIKEVKAQDFKSVYEQTEYCYRKARLYEQFGEVELAIAFYEATISTGKMLNVYYASYACLYLGELYYTRNNKSKAKLYFTMAMTFKENQEYKNSIEQKAKNGLRKLEQ